MGAMGDTCKAVTGLVVLAAGGVFLAAGMGNLSANAAHLYAGALLALAGLGWLVHAWSLCPMCKGKR